ncbi:MAG: M3 family oligoendopeptidase [Patescibacteria group bacterium]
MTDETAQKARWDLSMLYAGITDPQIDSDCTVLEVRMRDFSQAYKGKLATRLGDAIEAYSEISMLESKLGGYLGLQSSLNVTDDAVKAKTATIQRRLSSADGDYMTFLAIELAGLSDAEISEALKDPRVSFHKTWIEKIRILKPFMLSEAVEAALGKRSPFGPQSWSDFFDELESDLEFDWHGEKKTLPEMLHVLSESKDPSERASALHCVNQGLGGTFAKYSAETLYMVTGLGAVERAERKFPHPMHSRNLSNGIPDSVVDALHDAVRETAAPLAQRYYRLKAAHLGLPKLAWSDRNAAMPFSDTTKVSYADAIKMVEEAYASFSPTLSELVKDFVRGHCIDAPATKGKRGGAFNMSVVLPGKKPASWTFLNYLGSSRDVMTLAHELGHGVHGILAGREQGPLMAHAPIAYCETASVFGEMVSFNFLKEKLKTSNDALSYLALLMGKIDDILNTAVRQIGFSNFERRIHGMDASYRSWGEVQKLSVKDLAQIWRETLVEMYGAEGEVFTYENTENMWTYVSHFHRPFYVYGYAFGELLTHSLYAKRGELGDKFEPLYLDLLRSGSTKDAVELLAPFGLRPDSKEFWTTGISLSLGALLAEAETLSKEIGVAVR